MKRFNKTVFILAVLMMQYQVVFSATMDLDFDFRRKGFDLLRNLSTVEDELKTINDYGQDEAYKIHYALGVLYMHSDLGKAENELMSVIKTNPEHWNSYFMLGMTYMLQKKYNDAISNFNIAIKKMPEVKEVFYAMSVCYAYTGDTNLAFDTLEQGIRKHPDDDAMYYNQAVIITYYFKDRYDLALKYLEKAIEISPKDEEYLFLHGYLSLERHQIKKARKSFERIIELDKKNIRAILLLGQTYREEKKYGIALEIYKKAAQLDPENEIVIDEIKEIEAEINKLHKNDL